MNCPNQDKNMKERNAALGELLTKEQGEEKATESHPSVGIWEVGTFQAKGVCCVEGPEKGEDRRENSVCQHREEHMQSPVVRKTWFIGKWGKSQHDQNQDNERRVKPRPGEEKSGN